MKFIFTFFLFTFSIIGVSQDTIKQIDTTKKVIVVKPLPISIYNKLKDSGAGIEVTMYNTSNIDLHENYEEKETSRADS